MAKALRLSYDQFKRQNDTISALKAYFISRLRNMFPGIIVNGGEPTLYSVLSVSFPKTRQAEALLTTLSLKGICAAGGSACSGGGSHGMRELGRSENYVTIRFSFSRYNTKGEIDKVVEILKTILQPLLASPNC